MTKSSWIILSVLLATATLVLAPMIGAKWIGFNAVADSLKGVDDTADIYRSTRLPRVMMAFLAGAGLSICGAVFQALFRNSLATPFTLGVSSGAALGAAVCIRLGFVTAIWGLAPDSVAAFLGAVLSILIVYGLTRTRVGFSSSRILLAGVAMSFSFSSLIMFVQYVCDFSDSFRIVRWLMGSLDIVNWRQVAQLMCFVSIGGGILLSYAHELNLLSVDEELAASRGVDIKRTKKVLFVATSLTVGGVVSFCGPIAFVGLIAPHICRLIIGSNHRHLLPVSVCFGGTFLVWCDTLARTLIAPAEFPVGIITALFGGPFFICLIVFRKGST